MSSSGRVRLRNGTIVGHPIFEVDPVLASNLSSALSSHVKPNTLSSYDSATASYLKFCKIRSVTPFPVDPVWIAAYIVHVTMHISVSSLKVYLAAIRSSQIDAGFEWSIGGNVTISRTIRAMKLKYGMSGQALKVPISLRTLLRMCQFLRGWPKPAKMSHNDRLFVTASLIAILSFLRGGEFLWSPRSGRPVLCHDEVIVEVIDDVDCVSISISHPKARWWLSSAVVTCFDCDPSGLLNPSVWVKAYRKFSPVPLLPRKAAFLLEDGSVLSKAWMFRRTADLLKSCGVSYVGLDGQPVSVKASSWRSGGVLSARDAGVSDAIIKALGRWSSTAFFHYVFTCRADLRRAAASMWAASAVADQSSLVVGGTLHKVI
jgi:hypothetical protein